MRTELTLALLLAAGCDRSGSDLLPDVHKGFPSVIEVGELKVLTLDQVAELQAADDPAAWCAQVDENGAQYCLLDQVGSPEAGKRGGATYSFKGTGGDVCLMVDPETVYWSQTIALEGRDEMYAYPDKEADDGDLDLFAGMSSYYTGSPGIELGDFTGYYTDSMGREIAIEFGECSVAGPEQYDNPNPHSGRATAEYCTISTEQREGIEFTVVLDTFSVPLDDGVLSFATFVAGAACGEVFPPRQPAAAYECVFMGESLNLDGSPRECAERMELASCTDSLGESYDEDGWAPLKAFCCANPEMCGQDPPEDMCIGFERGPFCAANPDLCCD